MKVLVSGANGYIGFAVACALASAGHEVYGMVRKSEHAKDLQKNEIIPVLASVTDLRLLDAIVEKVSVVIDTVVIFDSSDLSKSSKDLISLIQTVAQRQGVTKRYIYTSGCLVYNYEGICDETLSANNPLMKWRADVEKFIVDSKQHDRVEGTVIRPGFVYGRSSGNFFGYLFGFDEKGDIEVSGNPKKRFGYIHVADLAEAYRLVTESTNTRGEIFDAVDASRVTQEEIRVACARVAGAKGNVVYTAAGTDFFSQACEVSCVSNGEKLRRYVGWQPKHLNILDHIQMIYESMKAYRN